MGQTREKKTSKRTLKAKTLVDKASKFDTKPKVAHLESATESTTGKQLAPSAISSLSAQTSHSSLRSAIPFGTIATNDNFGRYDPTLTEVRVTATKGLALFATTRIPKGSIVLAEVPLIRLTSEDEADQSLVDQRLERKYATLAKDSQRSFKKLHDTKKEGFSRMKSMYHSNCYNLEGWRSELGGSCLGLSASRINHSCVPNVQFRFFEQVPKGVFDDQQSLYSEGESVGGLRSVATTDAYTNGMMLFEALKTIPKDKEILSNYESIYATSTQRQLPLQMHYGFRCDCEACVCPTDFWSKSDDRRREMIRCRNELRAIEKQSSATSVTCGSPDASHAGQIVRLLESLEQLLVREGLLGIDLERIRKKLKLWKERSE